MLTQIAARDARIAELLAQVTALNARIGELEAKLGSAAHPAAQSTRERLESWLQRISIFATQRSTLRSSALIP